MNTDIPLYKAIDEILWQDWDPISINDHGPRDEYQGYTPKVFRLVKAGATQIEIATKLHTIEVERMGLTGSMEHCLSVADKILQAYSSIKQ